MKKKDRNQMNILELTPIQILGFEYRQDGQVDVLFLRFNFHIFGKKIIIFEKLISKIEKLMPQNRNPYIKANLDEIGSAAWELIDGKRTVKEIAVILEEKFKEQIAPVYERLAMFVQKMNANKFITFIEFMEK
jgi:hypothetical protein